MIPSCPAPSTRFPRYYGNCIEACHIHKGLRLGLRLMLLSSFPFDICAAILGQLRLLRLLTSEPCVLTQFSYKLIGSAPLTALGPRLDCPAYRMAINSDTASSPSWEIYQGTIAASGRKWVSLKDFYTPLIVQKEYMFLGFSCFINSQKPKPFLNI